MARNGRDLEILIHRIEAHLAGEEAQVESPGFIEDRITHQKREVDVLITMNNGHHDIVIAIECKDRKTPVGVPDIESFSTKVKDLKINKAVFVSSSGFRKTALEKAEFYNISCLDIDEIDSFDWLLTDHVVVHETKYLKSYWGIKSGEKELNEGSGYELRSIDGNLISDEILVANTKKLVEQLDLSECEIGKPYGQTFTLNSDNLVLWDPNTRQGYPVTECRVYAEFVKLVREEPFRRIKYSDVLEKKNITNAAVADVHLGDATGQIMVVENPDGTKSIIYSPKKDKDI